MKQIRAHGHGYANVECCSEEKKIKAYMCGSASVEWQIF
jgi:hypothetical protein